MKDYINIDTPGFFDMIDFANEVWKDLVGFEGYYRISNYSRILRNHREWDSGRNGCQHKIIEESMVKQRRLKDGYIKTTLCINGEKKSYSVHLLVAKTFMPNNDESLVVNHKDLNKDNNCLDNLEWCTHSENTKHWVENSGYVFHFENRAKKIKEKQRQEVLEVYLNNKKLTARKISEILGLTYNQVTKVIRDYKQNDIQRLSNSPSA